METKKNNSFLTMMGILFIIFMGLYIANGSGYYESKIKSKRIITENGIKEFESKVQNGEEIDLSSFLKTEKKDYSNNFSKLGDSLTNGMEYTIFDGMKFLSSIFKSLF